MTLPTVAEFAERYLAVYAGLPYHPAKNRRHAASVLGHYILPDLGSLRLDQVTPGHLASLQTRLFGRGLAFHTVQNAIFSGWGSLWKAARMEGLVVGKPHSGLLWPRRVLEPDPFTAEERDAILTWFERESIDTLPLAGCVFLAGMRPSEGCGLRWGDVNLQTGGVVIARAMASCEVTPGKTRNSRRSLRLSERLRAILARCRPSWAAAGDLIVRTRFGNPVDSQQFGSYWFKKCCAALGLRYRGFYSGRATYISLALSEGASITTLAKFCGTSVGTIERHYWRWIGELHDPSEARHEPGTRDDRPRVRRGVARKRLAQPPAATPRAPAPHPPDAGPLAIE